MKVNNNYEKSNQTLGLEYNHFDARLTPSMSNQSWSGSHKFEQHKKLKNLNKKREISHNNMPDLTNENQEWKISYYPSKNELLCEICGQTFTHINAHWRHMKMQHKPRNLICHECDYQTSRRDNMRRHLRMVHKLVKVGEILDTMKEVCTSNRSPTKAGKATKDKRKKSKPSIITMKLPAPINDESKSNGKNLAAPLNTQKKFHTKPIKKLPKRNTKKPEATTLTPVLRQSL